MIKILICGLPGSGKTTLAEPLARELGAVWINADKIRTAYNDWDFSLPGRIRQSVRMRHLSDGVVMAGRIAVVDFVCPTDETRKEFDADCTIWMNTITEGQFEDTNAMFEPLTKCDFIVTKWNNDTHIVLKDIIKNDRSLKWKMK